MNKQWKELKETIIEMRDNDGTGTQQDTCKFLANLMDALEKQMQKPCDEYVSKQKVVDLADELMHYCSPMEERTISAMSTHDIYYEFMRRSIAAGELLNDVCMLSTVEMSSCSDVIRKDLPPITQQPKTRWIPINDPSELPKSGDVEYWITRKDQHGMVFVDSVYWDMTEWSDNIEGIIAYMIKDNEPEPYKEESEK